MTRGTQPGLRFRTRKLSPKQPLPVLREDQIDSSEYKELLDNQFKVETGVEKSEENEFHLQQALASALSKGGNDAKNNVPAPPADESIDIKYDELYVLEFEEPSTFIRFSQTVEECTGCQYNMTSEDDGWLTEYNSKKSALQRCSEDDFEKIMEVFETTAEHHAPFAAVDNTPVVALDIMGSALKQAFGERMSAYTADIYGWWKLSRENSGNNPLQPSLKFEMHQDSDDGDPYVCFRRRDVRQTRKTRARDVQSTEKLKRLRKELDNGRQLVKLTLEREKKKLELILLDKQVFEQRSAVKKIRQEKGIKADQWDLITEKPQKRKPLESVGQVQRGPGPQMHLPRRADGRPLGDDLTTLIEYNKSKETHLKTEEAKILQQYHNQNKTYIDLTGEALTPVRGRVVATGFRLAATNYLITPPQSENSHSSGDGATPPPTENVDRQMMRYPMTPDENSPTHRAYRRRVGRGGRLWLDRRTSRIASSAANDWVADRLKYDQDDEDEEDIYTVNAFSTEAIKFRATATYPSRRSQPELPGAIGQPSNSITANPVARQSSSGHQSHSLT